ncbi:unnamed protein product [Adineta ricciae]|uniref:NAD(P)(+)--arginine ADP-ribosyltransferase n=1 Tax=Adineta ricciae TaxID=249248 RepID=A0A815FMC5_ADIRI|nr:unnamed protein product [Adineta ricciae]CAF1403219.1 unnamed protein product [Adineta ricciae]
MNLSIHDFTIIWLDANNEQPDTFFDRPSILTSIISDLHTFDNPSDCLDYITSIHSNIRIFLLVSGQLGKSIMSMMHDHSKICYVYIYCTNRKQHEKWTKDYSKIRGIYVDRTVLLHQLTADVALYSKELSAPITLFKRDDLSKQERSIRNLSKESSMFMWFQLLLETLLDSKQTINARKEMLNECKREYQEDPVQSSKIEEFEANYSPTEAVRWYTRDCFLFRLVNRAMRTQNIDTIYTYRSFILDLHKQLCRLSISTLDIDEVYRGQLMAFEEIEHMRSNINGLISINTYFSTSKRLYIASGFSGGGLGRPCLESVVFTIKIRPNMTEKPFANIQDYSYISQEGEVLFSAGTIFQIIDVSELTDGIWSVELNLSSDIQEQWYDVMRYLRTEMTARPTLVTLGNFLSEMGDLDKSERYYHLLMNELENEEDTGAILTAIAAVHFRKNDFTRALNYCNQGLEQLTALPHIHPDLATAYNIMGMIQLELNQLDDAVQYFKYALNVHEQTLPNDDPLIAADLHNMATVDLKAERFDEALTRFNRSLQIKLAVLPADHPLVGHTYANMGLLFAKQKQWTKAHYFYDKAIDIQQKTLPITHPDLAVSYANKASALVGEKQFDRALQLYNQALAIELARDPLCTSHLVNIYEQIGLIYIQTREHTEAIYSFEKALQHELNCHASWNQLCPLRNNLGTAHYKNGNYQLALKEYEAALDLIPSDDNSSKRFSTLNNIATAYFSMENYSYALQFYQKLIDTLDNINISPSKDNLMLIYQNIGLCYLAIEDNDLALEYFARVLSFTENPSILSKTHSYIADIFLNKNELTNAIENYELALKYDSSNEDFVITTYNSIGTAHHLLNDISKALSNYQHALNILHKARSNDTCALAAAYGNIANVYWQVDDFTNAIEYYTRQLNLETDPDVKHQIEEDIENIRLHLQLRDHL